MTILSKILLAGLGTIMAVSFTYSGLQTIPEKIGEIETIISNYHDNMEEANQTITEANNRLNNANTIIKQKNQSIEHAVSELENANAQIEQANADIEFVENWLGDIISNHEGQPENRRIPIPLGDLVTVYDRLAD